MSYKEKKASIVPLFIIVLFNLCFAGEAGPDYKMVIYVVIWSVAEEIIYRGILLGYLIKRGELFGIIVSSSLFAVSHLLNLFGSHNLLYTVLQVIFAFFVGICYAAVTLQYKSLIPCIAAHILTNLTGIYSVGRQIKSEWIVGLGICIVIYAAYGVFLLKKS